MHRRNLVKDLPGIGKKLILSLLVSAAGAILLLAGAATASAQSSGKHAAVWTRASIEKQFAGMAGAAKSTGSAGSILGSYDGHILQLSSRTASGQVEVHRHFVDVILVTKGQVTLLTGGTVVGGKEQADGEERGANMRGGVRHTISAGDLVHIPAGVPHQMLLQPGTLFEAEIVKVRIAK